MALALLLLTSAGVGLTRLNRPLPNADELLVRAVPEGAVLLDARGSLAYRRGHLPGARQLWSRALLAFSGEVPGVLAEPGAIAEKLRALGLTPQTPVVVYDDGDNLDAPQVLLVLRAFGVNAKLLEGGLAAWPGALSTETPTPQPSAAEFDFDDTLLVDPAKASGYLAANEIAPLDARAASAYLQGHLETAVDLPAEQLLPGGQLPRWSELDNQLRFARVTRDTHPLIYGEEFAQAARAYLALAAYGLPRLHVYPGPFEGLVAAGLPVSQTASPAATSQRSSNVCWQ